MAASQSSAPVRTCIGCRRPAVAAELFRVVAVTAAAGATDPAVQVVPDPRRRLPGRGAWLHPDPDCVALASRKRAFGRALRVSAPVDVTAVGEFAAEESAKSDKTSTTPPADRPQEMTSDEHSMKCQR